MSTTILLSLTSIECANCEIPFGLSEDFVQRRRQDHKSFSCPMGHHNVFDGETEAERLKRQVAQLQTSMEHKDAALSSLREQRGVHTRTCNRVKNGVCPCCNRTFSNLADHMHTKHPDFKAAE